MSTPLRQPLHDKSCWLLLRSQSQNQRPDEAQNMEKATCRWHSFRHCRHLYRVYSAKAYPDELRKVICENPEDGSRYIFLTNNRTASAALISELYRNRWSVELFFKWVKQHLKIKLIEGTSENAVCIQIYCVIITYCLLAIAQHNMKLERSIYEILQILGISLTDKTHIRNLFDKKNINDVKVHYGSSEPNLFNF